MRDPTARIDRVEVAIEVEPHAIRGLEHERQAVIERGLDPGPAAVEANREESVAPVEQLTGTGDVDRRWLVWDVVIVRRLEHAVPVDQPEQLAVVLPSTLGGE